jgi:hypothetical protein
MKSEWIIVKYKIQGNYLDNSHGYKFPGNFWDWMNYNWTYASSSHYCCSCSCEDESFKEYIGKFLSSLDENELITK